MSKSTSTGDIPWLQPRGGSMHLTQIWTWPTSFPVIVQTMNMASVLELAATGWQGSLRHNGKVKKKKKAIVWIPSMVATVRETNH